MFDRTLYLRLVLAYLGQFQFSAPGLSPGARAQIIVGVRAAISAVTGLDERAANSS